MGAMAKQDITIYYTSDLHGHFYPTTYGDKTQRALGLFRCAPGFVKTPNTLVIDGGTPCRAPPLPPIASRSCALPGRWRRS